MVFTLKEVLAEPGREEYIKTMEEEVESIFKENIWKRVPRKLMDEYYAEEREKKVKIKRNNS